MYQRPRLDVHKNGQVPALARQATTLTFTPPPVTKAKNRSLKKNRYDSFKNRIAVSRPYVLDRKNIKAGKSNKFENQFTLAENFLTKCKANSSKSENPNNRKESTYPQQRRPAQFCKNDDEQTRDCRQYSNRWRSTTLKTRMYRNLFKLAPKMI